MKKQYQVGEMVCLLSDAYYNSYHGTVIVLKDFIPGDYWREYFSGDCQVDFIDFLVEAGVAAKADHVHIYYLD